MFLECLDFFLSFWRDGEEGEGEGEIDLFYTIYLLLHTFFYYVY